MLINPYALAAGGGGGGSDPYFADVGILLHMDAAPVGSVTPDSSSNNITTDVVVSSGSGPFLNTTDQQVGTGCLDLASLAGGSSGGSYIQFPVTSPVDLGSGDYTVEIWDYQRSGVASIIFGTTYEAHIMLLPSSGTFSAYIEGTTLSPASVPNNQWNHVALVMASNAACIYVNGIQQASPQSITRSAWSDSPAWFVGGSQFGAAKEGMQQEFRITKVARYTSNFTPPSAPFPDS